MLAVQTCAVQRNVRDATYFALLDDHLLIEAVPTLYSQLGVGAPITDVRAYALRMKDGDMHATLCHEGCTSVLYHGSLRTRTPILEGTGSINVSECLFILAHRLMDGSL